MPDACELSRTGRKVKTVDHSRKKLFMLAVLAMLPLLLAGAAPQIVLSARAEEVARQIGFDRQVLILVKTEAQGGHIKRLAGYDDKDYQIMANGISIDIHEDKTEQILLSLRNQLRPLKYMVFVVDINTGLKLNTIGVIKGTDQYDILRIMQTNGDEYEIFNADVITRLKEWEKISFFEIVGADNDWVELEFKALPKELKAFAEEVYDFCPDAVDQGAGSINGLMRELQSTRRLFLWWD